jgi:hypothetical protein
MSAGWGISDGDLAPPRVARLPRPAMLQGRRDAPHEPLGGNSAKMASPSCGSKTAIRLPGTR